MTMPDHPTSASPSASPSASFDPSGTDASRVRPPSPSTTWGDALSEPRATASTECVPTTPEHPKEEPGDGLAPHAPPAGPGHLMGVGRGGMVGDARKRSLESPGQVLTARPVVDDATVASWRALLADDRCLCSSASTNWQALDDLLAEVQSLRLQLADVQADRNKLAHRVAEQRGLNAQVSVPTDRSEGPAITDPATGEPVDGGCPKHSTHWLARVVRQNRVGLGLPPQGCERRPGCPTEEADR